MSRKLGGVGDPPAPILHLPATYSRLEGLHPGSDVMIVFDGGLLVLAPPDRGSLAVELLKLLRRRSKTGGLR
jgi:antitoxin component of MazEF toxin-antitoxin module